MSPFTEEHFLFYINHYNHF